MKYQFNTAQNASQNRSVMESIETKLEQLRDTNLVMLDPNQISSRNRHSKDSLVHKTCVADQYQYENENI